MPDGGSLESRDFPPDDTMKRLLALALLATAVASAPLHAQNGTRALPRSTPEREGISSAAILSFVDAADTQVDAMNSFMLLRHGRVVGFAGWARGRSAFGNGLEKMPSVWPENDVAATGAWTSPDVFTVKLILYETPYYTTLRFHFDGDGRLLLDSDYNVSFGRTNPPQLAGQAER